MQKPEEVDVDVRHTVKPGENIFEHIGFDKEEANNLKIRSDDCGREADDKKTHEATGSC